MRVLSVVVALTSAISASTFADSNHDGAKQARIDVTKVKLVKANAEVRPAPAEANVPVSRSAAMKSKQQQAPNTDERFNDNIQGLPVTHQRYRHYD